ncbi:ABC transporter substrate-binding protein [Microlunatus elymi]|uniref:ABC transporter substrate-binding protein n=1 Tax=Microlunatus elymi TaxID=2596828 RepID=UPI00143D5BFB|nr:ABC transporter substrate-binding protein [Microlunatus elymi]
MTIDHALGQTTIAAAPKRVVTVGYTDHELFLALGLRPVGVRPWFGEKIDHTWPWVRDAWNGSTPTYVGGSELNFEHIASLRPDVIAGLYAEITDDEYAKLSAIAPTVARDAASAPYTTDRAAMFRTAGRVLGKTDAADRSLAEIDARFAEIRKEHPEFTGKTAAVVDPSQKSFYTFSSTDPRGRFLADLGFAAPTQLDKIIGDKFGAEISAERADLLELDRLLLLADAESRSWLDRNKIFQNLDVVLERRALEIPYYERPYAGAAMAYNTVLSVPYAVSRLVPKLAAVRS